jgi:hypothetical protein
VSITNSLADTERNEDKDDAAPATESLGLGLEARGTDVEVDYHLQQSRAEMNQFLADQVIA